MKQRMIQEYTISPRLVLCSSTASFGWSYYPEFSPKKRRQESLEKASILTLGEVLLLPMAEFLPGRDLTQLLFLSKHARGEVSLWPSWASIPYDLVHLKCTKSSWLAKVRPLLLRSVHAQRATKIKIPRTVRGSYLVTDLLNIFGGKLEALDLSAVQFRQAVVHILRQIQYKAIPNLIALAPPPPRAVPVIPCNKKVAGWCNPILARYVEAKWPPHVTACNCLSITPWEFERLRRRIERF